MTLKCIAGIEKPDRGTITLDGRVLFDSEKHINLTPQQRRVGYPFQQYALFPNMTAAQNILCGIRTGSRAEKKEKLAALLRTFRLEGLEKKLPAQLSGGQQQRVALARILASEPQAILLDELFSALDSYLKWELELGELLGAFDGPILWVSHDLGECCRNCARVCVMENGLTGALQPVQALLDAPASVSAAWLTGCKNFFPLTQKTAASTVGRCSSLPAGTARQYWLCRRRRWSLAEAARPSASCASSRMPGTRSFCCSRRARQRGRRCCARNAMQPVHMPPGRRFLFPSGKKSCCFSGVLDKISESCYDGSTLKNGGPCHADRNEEMHPSAPRDHRPMLRRVAALAAFLCGSDRYPGGISGSEHGRHCHCCQV